MGLHPLGIQTTREREREGEKDDTVFHVQCSQYANYRTAGKFGSLAVRVETAKLKSANVILYATCNDVLHAVALLAPSSSPLCSCTCS